VAQAGAIQLGQDEGFGGLQATRSISHLVLAQVGLMLFPAASFGPKGAVPAS
jgi:hypothetical protein